MLLRKNFKNASFEHDKDEGSANVGMLKILLGKYDAVDQKLINIDENTKKKWRYKSRFWQL